MLDAPGYDVAFDLTRRGFQIDWFTLLVGVFGAATSAVAAFTAREQIVRVVAPIMSAGFLTFGLWSQWALWMDVNELKAKIAAGDYSAIEGCNASLTRHRGGDNRAVLLVGERRFRLNPYSGSAGFVGRGVSRFENVCVRMVVVRRPSSNTIVWFGTRSPATPPSPTQPRQREGSRGLSG